MEEPRIRKLLDLLSFDQCKDLLVDFVREEPDAGNTLKIFIEKKLRKDEIENPEQLVDRSFSQTTQSGDYWHRRLVRDWESIDMESYNLFERAKKATAAGHPDAALIIGTRWLEDFAQYFDEDEVFYYDEECFSLSMDCEEAQKVIKEAINHPNISVAVKHDIAKRLTQLAQRKDNPFMDYGFLDIKELSNYINENHLTEEDTLSVLGLLLEEDSVDSKLIRQKYQLLKKLGRSQEAESFMEEHTDNYEVADEYVKELFEAKRFEKLIPILKGITEHNLETKARPTSRWLELLAQSQDSMGLKDEATESYRRGFIVSGGDMRLYKTLKQRLPVETWPQFKDDMLKQTEFATNPSSGKDNYAEILLLEGRFNEIPVSLRDNDITSLLYYLPLLPQEIRTDLYPIYTERILAIAQRAGSRAEYENIGRLLAKLKQVPKGEEEALKIAKILKTRYPRKNMFMLELRKALAITRL